MTSTDRLSTLAIRPASADDAATVSRLAALDSSPVPTGELLLGVVDGAPVAVLSLGSGAVVADPFTPTADLVAMLRTRGARLAAASTPRPRRAMRRALRAA